eukprot:5635103-Pyramimonas_sp.AAC.1
MCKACVAQPASFCVCARCGETLPLGDFAPRSHARNQKICRHCCPLGRPEDAFSRVDLGAMTHTCTHCSAKLFHCEGD